VGVGERQVRIAPLVKRTNNKAYKEACKLLVRESMWRLGRKAEFDDYVELLRLE
jgi:hypothetical protein